MRQRRSAATTVLSSPSPLIISPISPFTTIHHDSQPKQKLFFFTEPPPHPLHWLTLRYRDNPTLEHEFQLYAFVLSLPALNLLMSCTFILCCAALVFHHGGVLRVNSESDLALAAVGCLVSGLVISVTNLPPFSLFFQRRNFVLLPNVPIIPAAAPGDASSPAYSSSSYRAANVKTTSDFENLRTPLRFLVLLQFCTPLLMAFTLIRGYFAGVLPVHACVALGIHANTRPAGNAVCAGWVPVAWHTLAQLELMFTVVAGIRCFISLPSRIVLVVVLQWRCANELQALAPWAPARFTILAIDITVIVSLVFLAVSLERTKRQVFWQAHEAFSSSSVARREIEAARRAAELSQSVAEADASRLLHNTLRLRDPDVDSKVSSRTLARITLLVQATLEGQIRLAAAYQAMALPMPSFRAHSLLSRGATQGTGNWWVRRSLGRAVRKSPLSPPSQTQRLALSLTNPISSSLSTPTPPDAATPAGANRAALLFEVETEAAEVAEEMIAVVFKHLDELPQEFLQRLVRRVTHVMAMSHFGLVVEPVAHSWSHAFLLFRLSSDIAAQITPNNDDPNVSTAPTAPAALISLSRFIQIFGGRMEHKLQLHIARQIAAVLVHCHMQSPPLVHVGIRPANVFIDEVGKMVRVAEPDFECVFPGFARDVANRDPTLAPEVRREGGGTLTTKADVWGLGVCMWSCATGEFFTGAASYFALPSDLPPQYSTLIMECLNPEPEGRPGIEQIVAELNSMPMVF